MNVNFLGLSKFKRIANKQTQIVASENIAIPYLWEK